MHAEWRDNWPYPTSDRHIEYELGDGNFHKVKDALKSITLSISSFIQLNENDIEKNQ